MTALIPFEHGSPVPYYRQIYDAYRAAIIDGRLRPGQRLPSTRALATELNISRLPVVYAFEQLLHEGYVDGRSGSGTYVNATIPDELSRPVATTRTSVASPSEPGLSEVGPFRVSLPALDRFPLRLWSRLVARQAKNLTPGLMAYGDPAGHRPLREAIADYLQSARAVVCESDQVLIVSGSQMALQICAQALLDRGRTVCVEEPGYPGARDALRRGGARLVPVAIDAEGIDVEALEAQRNVRVVYVTPSHQYPLGVSMTASRRLALLEWARRSGAWIIEDDYDSEYRYASRPLGALQGLDSGGRVIYMGSFSKVLFPALRIGYLVVPAPLAAAFRQVRETLDLFPPVLDQLVLTEFLRDGHLARHIRRMRKVYRERRDALLSGLRAHAPQLEPHNTEAGLHLTAFLEGDDRKVVATAAREGIGATALSSCYLGEPRSGLILGFGGASELDLLESCRRLGSILDEHLPPERKKESDAEKLAEREGFEPSVEL